MSESFRQYCHGHVGETIKFYCADHDVCGCTVCITVNHRTCPGVKHLSEVVQELADKEEEWTTIEDIEPDIVTRLDNVITASRTNVVSIEEADRHVKQDIKSFRAELNTVLDKLENASNEKAELHRDKGLKCMNAYINKASKTMKKLKDLKSKASILKENKQYCELFVVVKEVKRIEEVVKVSLNKMETSNYIQTVAFYPDRGVKDCIKSMPNLGAIPTILGYGIENSSADADSEEDASQQPLSPEVAGTYVQDVCIQSILEAFTSSVNSLTVLFDERVILLDSANSMLKMMNVKKNKQISELKISARAVRKLKGNSIAVSVRNLGIVIVKTTTELIIERVLIKDEPFEAMSYWNDCIYYCERHSVKKVDIQGRKTDVVLTAKNLDGTRFYPKATAANRTLVSDGFVYAIGSVYDVATLKEKSESMVIVSSDGFIQAIIQLQNKPEAIESDDTGTLLFVLAEDNIYIMKVGTRQAKLILTKDDGLYNARSLAYSNTSKKLYVGMEDNNFIKVYQISGI